MTQFTLKGNESQCAACGTVFTSPSGHAKHKPGRCRNPADIGLVQVVRRGQIMWKLPGTRPVPGGAA